MPVCTPRPRALGLQAKGSRERCLWPGRTCCSRCPVPSHASSSLASQALSPCKEERLPWSGSGRGLDSPGPCLLEAAAWLAAIRQLLLLPRKVPGCTRPPQLPPPALGHSPELPPFPFLHAEAAPLLQSSSVLGAKANPGSPSCQGFNHPRAQAVPARRAKLGSNREIRGRAERGLQLPA